MISKEVLEADLSKLRKQFQQQLDNANATSGAIQYIESKLEAMTQPEPLAAQPA